MEIVMQFCLRCETYFPMKCFASMMIKWIPRNLFGPKAKTQMRLKCFAQSCPDESPRVTSNAQLVSEGWLRKYIIFCWAHKSVQSAFLISMIDSCCRFEPTSSFVPKTYLAWKENDKCTHWMCSDMLSVKGHLVIQLWNVNNYRGFTSDQ